VQRASRRHFQAVVIHREPDGTASYRIVAMAKSVCDRLSRGQGRIERLVDALKSALASCVYLLPPRRSPIEPSLLVLIVLDEAEFPQRLKHAVLQPPSQTSQTSQKVWAPAGSLRFMPDSLARQQRKSTFGCEVVPLCWTV